MGDGNSKPISEVKAGDKIANAVPGDRKGEANKVEKVIVTKTDHDFVDLTIATHDAHGRVGKLTTTDHHPFYDITQAAFVDAAHLRPGDHLQEPDGRTAEVLNVRRYTATAVTYDLTIKGLHTYYVLAGTTPVLVHNCMKTGSRDGSGLTEAELLEAAKGLRDDFAKNTVGPIGYKKRPATVTAGYNTETGQYAAGANSNGACAEMCVIDQLGGDASKVRFTNAVRPRQVTGPLRQVRVCLICEARYGRGVFMERGTEYETDKWLQWQDGLNEN